MATVLEHPHDEESHDEHGHGPVNGVFHQWEDIDQQNEGYIMGMWTFLVTEVLFFGALFLIYTLYRWFYQDTFYIAHLHLNVLMGGVNTMVLLFSSFTMVLAVHFTQLKQTKKVLASLGATLLCAFGFLVIKTFEYKEKFELHLVPGNQFNWRALTESHGGGHHIEPSVAANFSPNASQIFYSLYFTMTGLHAVHVIVGILLIGALAMMHSKGKKLVTEDYLPTEMIGLYWHFVDLVWIFLFPLFYLIPQ